MNLTDKEKVTLNFLRKVKSGEFKKKRRKQFIYANVRFVVLILVIIWFSDSRFVAYLFLLYLVLNYISGYIAGKSNQEMYDFASKLIKEEE